MSDDINEADRISDSAPGVGVERVVMKQCPGNFKVGDYVFACRWSDADWNDPWGIGFVSELGDNYVRLSNKDGSQIPELGVRAFRNAIIITAAQAEQILSEYPARERSLFIESVRDCIFAA